MQEESSKTENRNRRISSFCMIQRGQRDSEPGRGFRWQVNLHSCPQAIGEEGRENRMRSGHKMQKNQKPTNSQRKYLSTVMNISYFCPRSPTVFAFRILLSSSATSSSMFFLLLPAFHSPFSFHMQKLCSESRTQ